MPSQQGGRGGGGGAGACAARAAGAPRRGMAVRREFEEYWEGVGQHFERARPESGEEAWRRAHPAAAAREAAAREELRALEARLEAAERARASVRRACAAEEAIRGLADRAGQAFCRMRGKQAGPGPPFPGRLEPGQGRREQGAGSFRPPGELPREANTAFPPGPDVWGPGRARAERWGTNPLLGGGATIRREAGRLDYERLRGQLAERTREMEQDIELKAGLAEALRLYRDGGAGRAAEGGVD